MDTSDTRWANCTEDWERLRWARSRAGLTQGDFAEAVGMNRTAYLKYEARPGGNTQHTPLKFEQARPWAKKLKIRWEWLLDGEGTPWLDEEERPALIEELADTAAKASPEDQELLLSMARRMIAGGGQ